MLCCGAVGGEEERAIPAAAAVEVAHNWTLVHDDIMDRDQIRRGKPTVHVIACQIAQEEGLASKKAEHYGLSMALSSGDLMHAWSVLLCLKLREKGLSPEVTLSVAERLERAIAQVIEGQALDLDFARRPLEKIDEKEPWGMVYKKTVSLFEFCAVAGAMIGKGREEDDFPEAEALRKFGRSLGVAFQLKDDFLGIFGEEEELGKPVGSDVEEGKRTPLIVHAYYYLHGRERRRLKTLLGRKGLTKEELEEFRGLVMMTKGMRKIERVMFMEMDFALSALKKIPESPQKEILEEMACFAVMRTR